MTSSQSRSVRKRRMGLEGVGARGNVCRVSQHSEKVWDWKIKGEQKVIHAHCRPVGSRWGAKVIPFWNSRIDWLAQIAEIPQFPAGMRAGRASSLIGVVAGP